MTTTYPVIDVTATSGIPFRAVYVPADATLPNHPKAPAADGATVEFYDRRYDFTPDGQFTGGRYYACDIIDGEAGLILDDGIPAWRIDAGAMRIVRQWLNLQLHHA